jgi:uncharacterized protein (TIGR02246 family)
MQKTIHSVLITVLLTSLLAIGCIIAYAFPAAADQQKTALEAQILTVYREFLNAQNAHDLERIGSFFVEGPDFLWVSDGRSVWGREATLARMGSFQKAPVWKVHPELDQASVVQLGPETAMLHFPLELEIGQRANPDRLGFLVSALFVRNELDWRIAALLTTARK